MKRLANPCTCDRLHMWTDGQPFRLGHNGWDGYCTVVIDDGAGPLTPGTLYSYMGVGNKTSNECEYSGIILALEWAKANGERVHVITDSDLILGHLERGDRCTQHLKTYRDRVRELLGQTDAKVTWQGRDFNKAGWYNAGVLVERHRAKAARQRASGVVKRPKKVRSGPRRWAFQNRRDDD